MSESGSEWKEGMVFQYKGRWERCEEEVDLQRNRKTPVVLSSLVLASLDAVYVRGCTRVVG